MGGGAWRATVLGVARVRHDLATTQQQKNMCINESLCCTPEINITLQINYPSTLKTC